MLLAAREGLLYTSMHGGIHIWNAADPYALSLEGVYYPPQTRARGPFMVKTPAAAPTTRQLEAEKAQGTFIAHEEFPFESLPCSRRYIENGEILGAATLDDLLFVRVGYAYCVGPEQEFGGREGDGKPFYQPVIKAVEAVEDGGLWVLNVSDPAEPFAVAFLPLQFRYWRDDLRDVTVTSNHVYLTSQSSLSEDSIIVDLSEPSKPVLLERQLNADLVVWEDNLLFVSVVHIHDNGILNYAGYTNGLQVFDVLRSGQPHPYRHDVRISGD